MTERVKNEKVYRKLALKVKSPDRPMLILSVFSGIDSFIYYTVIFRAENGEVLIL